MSYCQKHQNHHCVHAHNCTNKNHKKNNHKVHTSCDKNGHHKQTINKKYNPPMGTIIDNEQCHFISSNNNTISPLQKQQYIKTIQSLRQQMNEIKRKNLNNEIENKKLRQKNGHLQSQIQYFRSQLDLLVSNHNTDIHQQIKKNLILIRDLNIKIKQLTHRLYDKQKLAEESSSQNYQLNRRNKLLQKSIKSLEQKMKLTLSKNTLLSNQLQTSKSTIKSLQNQLKILKDRYSTLSISADKSIKNKQNQLIEVENQISKLQRQFKNKSNEINKTNQLHNIQKNTYTNLIDQLKTKLSKRQAQISKLKQSAKSSEQQLNELKQNYQHVKKMVLKYQNLHQQSYKIKQDLKLNQPQNQLQITESQKKTIQKINSNQLVNQSNSQKINIIQKQNMQLMAKIFDLQSRLSQLQTPLQNKTNLHDHKSSNLSQNITINQELILSIGASEQFKKIVQQKNTIIKKLMRQKTQLYNQIYLQQAYKQ